MADNWSFQGKGGEVVVGQGKYILSVDSEPLEKGLQQSEQTAKQASKAIGNDLKQGTSNASMGLMQLSNAIDDVQYGFRGIVNNIPGIVQGMGFGMGIAGAAQIAAVGINTLVNHWDELSDKLSANWSGSSVEQLKALREHAEEAAEAFDKLANATESQVALAKGVGHAITEGPKDEIVKGVANAIGHDPTLKASRFEAFQNNKTRLVMAGDKAAEELNKIVQEENVKTAQKIIGGASIAGPKGDADRRTLNRLAKQFPGAFPDEFAADLKAATPEEKQRIAQLNLEGQANREARKKEREAEKEDERNFKHEEEKQDRLFEKLKREKEQKDNRLQHLNEQKSDLLERRSRIMRPDPHKPELFSSTAEFINKLQTAGPEQLDRQKLDQLKDVNKNLGRVEEAIKKLNARAG